ncbi:XdhC/CoxI family protein [Bacillus sp. AFS055030]|uniref:XdhC family protein n=1 Tax=Bacillus sp. AFS055030 TaxID=2033507 RepID=UPI000BFD6A6C|nr:XdhC/CoxI family protein [Bacillus sp. AFS055030]PGL71057.1 xanthine dehydrogenase [Bacillus sp. AFS055030]
MESIHEILNEITSSKEGDVLATIIHVEGSAYRKEGTSMLFKGNGKEVGLLSAGCLETDLAYRVQETRVWKTPQTVTYDMSAEDDLTWGNGAGCNGIITVLLEPIDDSLFELLTKLKKFLLNGTSVSMMKILFDHNKKVETLFLVNENTFFGNCNERILDHLKSVLNELHDTHYKSGLRAIESLTTKVYLHTFHPKPRLIVFGAGKDAIPLVKLASIAGFFVTITDWRADLCSREYFPDADQIFVGFPSEIIPRLQLTTSDSAIIITHQFQKDKEILNHLLNINLKYLGVLGGKKRIQRLMDGKKVDSEINSPAGLQIGAEGPEEIAISIIAELIQRQRIKKESKHE